MSKNWYVIQVISAQEKKAKLSIEEGIKQHGMENSIDEVHIPTENVLEIKNGKQQVVEKRLWPGYLLVKMDLNDDSWMFIKQSNGVIDFLGGSKPSSLTDIEVENLQKDLQKKQQGAVVQKKLFDVGSKVKIVSGVFVNFLGTVIEVNTEKGRLNVMVSIFGRETRVDDLELWQIEECNDDDEINS